LPACAKNDDRCDELVVTGAFGELCQVLAQRVAKNRLLSDRNIEGKPRKGGEGIKQGMTNNVSKNV
jgi:hypothetical protein